MDDQGVQQDIAQVVEYVLRRGFKRVTLQFPDDQLQDAPLVAAAMSNELAAVSDAQVYILADTTYNPLAVDEVAAEHVNADCVIHYGHASLSPVSRTPALCILPRQPVDVDQCSTAVADLLAEANGSSSNDSGASSAGLDAAVLLHDQAYHHAWPALQQAIQLAYQGPLQLISAQLGCLELDPIPHLASSCGRPTGISSHTAEHVNGPTAGVQQAPAEGQESDGADTPSPAAASSSAPVPSDIAATAPSAAAANLARSTAAQGSSISTAPNPCSGAVPAMTAAGGLTWQQPAGMSPERCLMLWIGPTSSPVLMALQMTHSSSTWLAYDPDTGEVTRGVLSETAKLLKRRYYLVEKARSASIIGILVGTLGAAGYKDAIARIRSLARAAGKHTYTILVGKPSPAKLANFPEVEVFVMVADPLGLILDSREYLAPVITPHEALLAFGKGESLDPATYRLDFGELLTGQLEVQSPSSSIGAEGDRERVGDALALPTSLALSQKGRERQVAPKTAAEYLQLRRSYKGLETPATGADIKAPMLAVQGLSGRAAGYSSEPAAAPGGSQGVQDEVAADTLSGSGHGHAAAAAAAAEVSNSDQC